jgi:TfoX/Sxy family transcriptional regulator of competence genes
MNNTDKAAKQMRIKQLENALCDAFLGVKPDTGVTVKAMFGGAGFYADGSMIAAYFGEGLALKLPEDAQTELLTIDGAKRSQSASYIEVPEAFIRDPKLLEPWVERAFAYVSKQSKPAKRRK